MNYLEYKIIFSVAEPWKDIIISMLAEEGFDSFADGNSENELCAYVSESMHQPEKVNQLLQNHGLPVQLTFSVTQMENRDWNEVWESNYTPVLIANRCYIRAPFHEPHPKAEIEIVIEPKMSFGTAHHETTALMIELLLDEPLFGKSLLDMGAGTGVLAILTRKKGANPVLAIDNDEWAYRNNIENNERNQVPDIEVKLGDASLLTTEKYDVILANINRNVLLNDIQKYAVCLKNKGNLFMSGFYKETDLDMIVHKCAEHKLSLVCYKEKNGWVAAKFVKS